MRHREVDGHLNNIMEPTNLTTFPEEERMNRMSVNIMNVANNPTIKKASKLIYYPNWLRRRSVVYSPFKKNKIEILVND